MDFLVVQFHFTIYQNDKKYFWTLTLGLLLLIIFIGGLIADLFGYINFILYTFPLWGFAPVLQLYGACRLLQLKIQNDDYNKNDIEELRETKVLLMTVGFCAALLIILYIWAILNGRIHII